MKPFFHAIIYGEKKDNGETMIQLKDYLNNPCRSLSIPYWKQNRIKIPSNMKIVHDNEFNSTDFVGYLDEPYFRLYHNLQEVQQTHRADIEVVVGATDMLDIFVNIINESYTDLMVTKEQIKSYQKTSVYCAELWVLLKDKSGAYIGCGIADYDKKVGEMILEWIQVLPSYRGRGYGKYIVNFLLTKMKGKAKFATVSGKVNNATNPEKLYRKCGFIGNDIWHILIKS